MDYAKIINNNLEYFVQPHWILGDASQYAIENGYKELIQNTNIPEVPPNEKLVVTWEEFSTYITQSYQTVPKTPEEIEQERISNIPAEISKRQLNLALFAQLNIESPQIEAMIQSIPDEYQRKITEIEWRDGAFVARTHPFVNSFAEQLGITQRQLDDLFTYAKNL